MSWLRCSLAAHLHGSLWVKAAGCDDRKFKGPLQQNFCFRLSLLSPTRRCCGCQVVAAELTSGGSKDVVMFVIRVADDTGEWTIARRFRHFESLHRSLRGCAAAPSKAPASVLC